MLIMLPLVLPVAAKMGASDDMLVQVVIALTTPPSRSQGLCAPGSRCSARSEHYREHCLAARGYHHPLFHDL